MTDQQIFYRVLIAVLLCIVFVGFFENPMHY